MASTATQPFQDRMQAGRLLGRALAPYADREDVIVLGLPRGGVPVAFQVAAALRAPLDVFLVRKLGAPGQEELALGAIAPGGVRVLNEQLIAKLRLSARRVEAILTRERRELERRELAYREARPALELSGRTAIVVDDGLATGSTMIAAVEAVRRRRPARVVVAVPVADRDVCELLRRHAGEAICLLTPHPMRAVGSWYCDFAQTSDGQVRELLRLAREAQSSTTTSSWPRPTDSCTCG